jgi:hypothetical protein
MCYCRFSLDFWGIMSPQLAKISAQFGKGVEEGDCKDPCLYRFVELIAVETRTHYDPYATGIIIKGSIHGFLGMILKERIRTEFPDTAGRWPAFFREKTGIGEVFAHFMFPETTFREEEYLEVFIPTIPDIAMLGIQVNDIFSFYKGSVVGKEGYNYILGLSRMVKLSPVGC